MPLRKIIEIDESLCNGCGDCVVGCAEGALRIVDGKAKMVREDYCDGFGDCVGTCPTGALTIVEREVPEYDPAAARAHVARTRGADGVAEFDAAAQRHEPARSAAPTVPQPPGGGCPGSRMRVFPTAGGGVSPSSPNPSSAKGTPVSLVSDLSPQAAGRTSADPGTIIPSSLGQWPIMLHLVQPQAPFFKDRELCILSTCSPVAMPDAQWRYVRDRGVVVACPKLDRTEGYVAKLTAILAEPSIPRAVVVRMEVPCCSGLTALAVQAAQACGREDLQIVEATVSLDGKLLGEKVVHDVTMS
jgi:NAD-dependent dihydropyrimidine dehydrogenase PreA subunit